MGANAMLSVVNTLAQVVALPVAEQGWPGDPQPFRHLAGADG
jgi:hypothetical protein